MKARRIAIRPSDAAGFSLMEMLVVLVIVSIITGISAISVQQIRNGKSPYRYAADIAESMTALRYRALNTGHIQKANIDIEGKTISDTERKLRIVLPKTWALSVTIGRELAQMKTVPQIIFLPDGTSSGAHITLKNPAGETAYVRVNWLTGLTEYSSHAF